MPLAWGWLAVGWRIVAPSASDRPIRSSSSARSPATCRPGSSTSSTPFCLLLVIGLSMSWSFTEEWGEYFALLFWATVGMMLLTASEELVTLFLTLETMTICLYLRTAFEKTKRRSAEGGSSTSFTGRSRRRLFLFGLSLVYGMTGTTMFDGIHKVLSGPRTPGTGQQRGRGDGDPAHPGRLRVQGRRGAVPPVGARRLRRGTGAGDGVDRDRLEAGQLRGAHEGLPARPAPVVEPRRRASSGRAGSASSRSSRPSR